MMLVLAGLAMAVGLFAHNSVVGGRNQLHDKQAFYIAEAGWQRARQALSAATWSAATGGGNTYSESFGAGEYRVTIVDNGNSTYTITSEGYVPSQTNTQAKRKIVETNLSVSTSSGSNLSLTATASASSSHGGDVPANAKDGNLSTIWRSDTNGSGSWLAMDYGSATSLDKVIIKEDNNIDGLTIEWSDNASSWTVASGLSVVESPSQTWTATFTAVSHRYFRSRFTSVPSSSPARVKEMESYSTSTTYGTGAVTTTW